MDRNCNANRQMAKPSNLSAFPSPLEGEGQGGGCHCDDPTQLESALATASPPASLYRLLAWLSPAFPVGAYTYSHGLEYAVEARLVRDAATARAWLQDILEHGASRADVTLLCEAARAAGRHDWPALFAIAELAAAFQPTRELALESQAQGRAFVEAATKTWDCEALRQLRRGWEGPIAYPVAVGVLGAGHGIALADLAHGFVQAFIANLVSAAVRLVPLGQTDGQLLIAALETAAHEAATAGLVTPLDDIGTATLMVDHCSMRHETQYTRLFRS